MKNAAVQSMIAIQYNFDLQDVEVKFIEFYNGEYHFEIKHTSGRTFKYSVRGYDTTPLWLENIINDN